MVGDHFYRDCSEKVCLRSSALKKRIAGKREGTASEKALKQSMLDVFVAKARKQEG